MVEIRYGEQYEVADLAGQTVSEAREQFRDEFGIPDKARAKLNGSKIKGSTEMDTVLNDDDKVSFAVAKSRAPFMVGALLLALAATGGVFAFGFINASTTLTGASVSDYNFAEVSDNTTGIANIEWSGHGYYKGTVGAVVGESLPQPIFNIDTASSGYTGDLVVTVTIGNADALAKYYRVLALKLDMATPDGNMMDINESGANNTADWVMLTLDNGSVSMFPGGTANTCTVRVKSGFYITHVKPHGSGWGSGSNPQPDLFCEVAQR